MIAGLPKWVLEDAADVGRRLNMLREIFTIIRPLDLDGRRQIIRAAAALLDAGLEDLTEDKSGNLLDC